MVRTTVNLDDDVLAAARSLARARGESLGVVLSELVRRALAPTASVGRGPGGFPTFQSPEGVPPLTAETVRAALDDDS